MCGRVRLTTDYSEIKIALKFHLSAPAPNFEVDWNKPPTAPMLVAIRSEDGERIPRIMRWGLVPHWAKNEKISYSTFNARSEDFTTKPAFRDAWTRGQWPNLKYDTRVGGYVVGITEQHLKGAPRFNKNSDWDWTDRSRDREVYDYYGDQLWY